LRSRINLQVRRPVSSLFPDRLLRGFLVVATKLHLPEDAFALHLLRHPQRRIDVVVEIGLAHRAQSG